jgi:hypothetical protein
MPLRRLARYPKSARASEFDFDKDLAGREIRHTDARQRMIVFR